MILNGSLKRWWSYDLKIPKDLDAYSPWKPYPESEQIYMAYNQMLIMPRLWPELREAIESLQTKEDRNQIYEDLSKLDTRKRNWYTCKRKPGIIHFVVPSIYERGSNGYPRVTPRGTGSSKMGLLSSERNFRKEVLSDIDSKLQPFGYALFEVDLESCHTQILADLSLGTVELNTELEEGESLWKSMVNKLPKSITTEFAGGPKGKFNFLKKCLKRLCYKALQGGRIDTSEKIRRTLELEEKQIGKDLKELSESFSKNTMLMEFDFLNQEIMRRYGFREQLRVYSPIEPEPFTLIKKGASQEKYDWYTSNPCRVASQIVTGVEMFQILLMLDQMQKLELPWIQLSLHHDGCALLLPLATFEKCKERLVAALKKRLTSSRMQIKGLEFTRYESFRGKAGETQLQGVGDEARLIRLD